YAVWDEIPADGPSRSYFSRSTDAGRTWSDPAELPARGDAPDTHSPHLLVLRNGNLRVFFEQGERGGTRRWMRARSGNRGHTWPGPQLVRKQLDHLPTTDGSEPFYAIFEQTVNVSPN